MELREGERHFEQIFFTCSACRLDVGEVPIRGSGVTKVEIETRLVIIFSNCVPGEHASEAARIAARSRENEDSALVPCNGRNGAVQKIVLPVEANEKSARGAMQMRSRIFNSLTDVAGVSRAVVPQIKFSAG